LPVVAVEAVKTVPEAVVHLAVVQVPVLIILYRQQVQATRRPQVLHKAIPGVLVLVTVVVAVVVPVAQDRREWAGAAQVLAETVAQAIPG
jgi:hypothetical protein